MGVASRVPAADIVIGFVRNGGRRGCEGERGEGGDLVGTGVWFGKRSSNDGF